MMITPSESFSTTVRMTLVAGQHTFDVAQMRPGVCTLRDPKPLEPTAGELTLRVDDDLYRYSVFLTDGISAESQEVRYEIRN
jgi:hypothetical protein